MSYTTGTYLLRRLEDALVEAKDHIEIYEEFSEDLNKHHEGQLEVWRIAILEYERGTAGAKSPYEVEAEGKSLGLLYP